MVEFVSLMLFVLSEPKRLGYRRK